MMTNEDLERVRGWFTGRLPEEWKVAAPEVSVDREEITVILTIADVDAADDASEAERDEARVGRASAGSSARSRGACVWPGSPTRPPCSPTWPRR